MHSTEDPLALAAFDPVRDGGFRALLCPLMGEMGKSVLMAMLAAVL
jgi:hypothetical protein